jgi:hypothetical protein
MTHPGSRVMPTTSVPTWPVAGGSLVVGFLVAELSGVRALGGVVLLAALASAVVALVVFAVADRPAMVAAAEGLSGGQRDRR